MLTEPDAAHCAPGECTLWVFEDEVVDAGGTDVEVRVAVQSVLHVSFVELPVYLCARTLCHVSQLGLATRSQKYGRTQTAAPLEALSMRKWMPALSGGRR